jgi:nucleoside-diphosphate-sugar epimerase
MSLGAIRQTDIGDRGFLRMEMMNTLVTGGAGFIRSNLVEELLNIKVAESLNMKDKNILITGISGFVGSRMAKRLVEEGANVFGLLRRRADGKVPHNMLHLGLGKEIRLVEGDLESISSIEGAITASEPDIIFHLAAQSFVPRSFEDTRETMLCNCWGTSNRD